MILRTARFWCVIYAEICVNATPAYGILDPKAARDVRLRYSLPQGLKYFPLNADNAGVQFAVEGQGAASGEGFQGGTSAKVRATLLPRPLWCYGGILNCGKLRVHVFPRCLVMVISKASDASRIERKENAVHNGNNCASQFSCMPVILANAHLRSVACL